MSGFPTFQMWLWGVIVREPFFVVLVLFLLSPGLVQGKEVRLQWAPSHCPSLSHQLSRLVFLEFEQYYNSYSPLLAWSGVWWLACPFFFFLQFPRYLDSGSSDHTFIAVSREYQRSLWHH